MHGRAHRVSCTGTAEHNGGSQIYRIHLKKKTTANVKLRLAWEDNRKPSGDLYLHEYRLSHHDLSFIQ